MTAPLTNEEAVAMLRIALAEIERKDAELAAARAQVDQAQVLARNSMARVDVLAAELVHVEAFKREVADLCRKGVELVRSAQAAEDRSRFRSMHLLQDANRLEDSITRVRTLAGGPTA